MILAPNTAEHFQAVKERTAPQKPVEPSVYWQKFVDGVPTEEGMSSLHALVGNKPTLQWMIDQLDPDIGDTMTSGGFHTRGDGGHADWQCIEKPADWIENGHYGVWELASGKYLQNQSYPQNLLQFGLRRNEPATTDNSKIIGYAFNKTYSDAIIVPDDMTVYWRSVTIDGPKFIAGRGALRQIETPMPVVTNDRIDETRTFIHAKGDHICIEGPSIYGPGDVQFDNFSIWEDGARSNLVKDLDPGDRPALIKATGKDFQLRRSELFDAVEIFISLITSYGAKIIDCDINGGILGFLENTDNGKGTSYTGIMLSGALDTRIYDNRWRPVTDEQGRTWKCQQGLIAQGTHGAVAKTWCFNNECVGVHDHMFYFISGTEVTIAHNNIISNGAGIVTMCGLSSVTANNFNYMVFDNSITADADSRAERAAGGFVVQETGLYHRDSNYVQSLYNRVRGFPVAILIAPQRFDDATNQNSNNLYMGNQVFDFDVVGIQFSGSGKAIHSMQNTVIRYNFIHGDGRAGQKGLVVSLAGVPVPGLVIEDNPTRDCGGAGLSVYNCIGAKVKVDQYNCGITEQVDGASATLCDEIKVSGKIDGAAEDGFTFASCPRVNVDGLEILDIGKTGINGGTQSGVYCGIRFEGPANATKGRLNNYQCRTREGAAIQHRAGVRSDGKLADSFVMTNCITENGTVDNVDMNFATATYQSANLFAV